MPKHHDLIFDLDRKFSKHPACETKQPYLYWPKIQVPRSSEAHFVSFATINWIDVFVRRIYCEIVAGWQQNNHPIELSIIEMFNQRPDNLQTTRLSPARWHIRRIIYIAVQ